MLTLKKTFYAHFAKTKKSKTHLDITGPLLNIPRLVFLCRGEKIHFVHSRIIIRVSQNEPHLLGFCYHELRLRLWQNDMVHTVWESPHALIKVLLHFFSTTILGTFSKIFFIFNKILTKLNFC